MNRRSLWLAMGLVVGILLCTGMAIFATSYSPSASASPCLPGVEPLPSGVIRPIGRWNAEQVGHAATIYRVGRERGVPARGWVIAVATAMQESKLKNLRHLGPINDHDSLGLFQQRPSQGWGTPEQLLNPVYASGKFYEALVKVAGWQTMRLTDAAQAVQRSQYPEAYQQWETDAERLVAALAGVNDIGKVPGGSPINCGPVPPISSGGWTQPVKAAVGQPFRGGHFGVDLSAPRHMAIRAAAAGVVVEVVCNSSSGTCDEDGNPDVKGCGWYVDIFHIGDIVTRYCHMVRQPSVSKGQQVTAGQVIGFVGSSGNSSGPHLHYEVHLSVKRGQYAGNENASDPQIFHERVGAKLG